MLLLQPLEDFNHNLLVTDPRDGTWPYRKKTASPKANNFSAQAHDCQNSLGHDDVDDDDDDDDDDIDDDDDDDDDDEKNANWH